LVTSTLVRTMTSHQNASACHPVHVYAILPFFTGGSFKVRSNAPFFVVLSHQIGYITYSF
jgi:hypothetical protein